MLSRRHDDEYDGGGDDVRDGDGSDTDPWVPLLEADGHRLGSSARRGVTVMGLVPAPTRLSIPELDWLERARSNAGGTVKVPPHRWTRHDSSAVDSARSELYSMASRQIENTKRARRERQRDEEGVLPLGSASPMDMLTRDFNERPLIPWHQTSTGRAGVLTTFVEWDSIRSTTGKKVLYMFTFPVFMMTYIPIALVALVKKCNWKPIKHSISVDVAELSDAASAAPQKQRERTM